ncbi:class I SAM-dependent methyltransferase [Oceanispirochaeta crateris]|nr:class I SAM-dependent methyltransferase [Oceanispirochaeta crateris]
MSKKSADLYDHTLDYYNSNAAETFRLYGSKPSPYKDRFKAYFKAESEILDIGSGSGRDVQTLLEQGFDAYGMDASEELIRLSKSGFKELADRFKTGSLPDEIPDTFSNREWDGILCSAVLQHIPDNHLFDTTFTFHRLLKIGGRLLVTVPLTYPGIINDRDAKDRLFRIRPAQEYVFLFERIGFQLVSQEERSDGLNRGGISWSELLFQKKDLSGIRAIDGV